MSEFIRVGQIVGAHGIQGYVKVQPLTDFTSRFKKGSRFRMDGNWIEVVACTFHKGRPTLLLSGVKSRNDAEALQWKYLEAAAEDEPELEEDEYFTDDLLGLKVVTTEGRELGEVEEVMDMPAHQILVVGEVLIPLIKEFIEMIDLDEEVVTVKLIPGMLPDEE